MTIEQFSVIIEKILALQTNKQEVQAFESKIVSLTTGNVNLKEEIEQIKPKEKDKLGPELEDSSSPHTLAPKDGIPPKPVQRRTKEFISVLLTMH
jgi:hypothetical protein